MEKYTIFFSLLILAIQFHELLCINAARKTQVCSKGPCNLTCGSNNICNQTCSALPCNMSCDTSNVCWQTCKNGNCDSMTCEGALNCDVDCEGGSCLNMHCSAKNTCQLKCNSSCSMVLSGPTSSASCNAGKCNITFTEKSTFRMVICPQGDCNIFCPVGLDCSPGPFPCPRCTVTYYGSTTTTTTTTTSDSSPTRQARNVSIIFSLGFSWTIFLGFFRW